MANRIKKIFEISEYREKKELYEACGYKEVVYKEKNGIHCYVTFEADSNMPHYKELKQVANSLKKKGPPFFPTLIFILIAFALLTIFLLNLVRAIHDGVKLDLFNNIVYYVIPAGTSLLIAVIYTIYYFHTNQRILLEQPLSKEEILKKIEDIKQK